MASDGPDVEGLQQTAEGLSSGRAVEQVVIKLEGQGELICFRAARLIAFTSGPAPSQYEHSFNSDGLIIFRHLGFSVVFFKVSFCIFYAL